MGSLPLRSCGGANDNGDYNRPRYLDSKTKRICWSKADIVPGRRPERWRKDASGNIVCKRFGNCEGCLCFEYDHIVPFSKGGESVADNCLILQTRVSRFKSDKDKIDPTQLKGYSCDINFTDDATRKPMSLLKCLAKSNQKATQLPASCHGSTRQIDWHCYGKSMEG